MQELYQITLHSQLGPRPGRLALFWSGGKARGTLSLVGHDNPVTGERGEDGRLVLIHPLRTALGEHPCRSILTLAGDSLTGVAELAGCRLRWSGQRLPVEGGEGLPRE